MDASDCGLRFDDSSSFLARSYKPHYLAERRALTGFTFAWYHVLLFCCISKLLSSPSLYFFATAFPMNLPYHGSTTSGQRHITFNWIRTENHKILGALPKRPLTSFFAPKKAFSSTAVMGIKGFRSWFESQFPHAMCAMPRDKAHDTFDHVLIDMNQLLHICLRKSRSEGHALTLLMKELDACCQMATPTKSLVLAMDGPPSASKLATQRKRRLQAIIRRERKLQQIDQLSNQMAQKKGSNRKLLTKRQQARKKRRYVAETRTLCITPGTDFMKLTEQAICYWAWQRMQFNNPNHFLSKVKIFISPSTVPGEGEVKLLEWVLRQTSIEGVKRKQGESIAILGGDSDLVLEGLVIPPSCTHNVFVLLPDGNRKYLCVSLWETTLALKQYLPDNLPSVDFVRVRTDLVLLLILNGNDYFPKLRGSSGFNKVFHTYLKILRSWLMENDRQHHPPYLVDPEALTYNLPFCLAFFRLLEQLSPENLLWSNASVDDAEAAKQQAAESRITPLAKFHNFLDAGFLPKPVHWRVMDARDDSGDERELSEEEDGDGRVMEDDYDDGDGSDDAEDDDIDEVGYDDDEEEDEDDEEIDPNQILISLKMGKPGTEDFITYEVWHNRKTPLKKAKHKLARMALEDLIGDVDSYFDGSDEDNNGDGDGDLLGMSEMYSWEVKSPAKARPDAYLGGLLWNLQTYQDGTCSDYSFNYGKRLAPTAEEIVKFLKEAQYKKKVLGMQELIGYEINVQDTFPISAGVSCLAALPSEVRELVPEPYRQLDREIVEQFYGDCMDPEDNVFDMKKFEQLCDEEVEKLSVASVDVEPQRQPSRSKEIKISTSRQLDDSHYWIVLSKSTKPLSHPIDPPPPFSERLSELRPNNRIRVNRINAFWEPRRRTAWNNNNDLTSQEKPRKGRRDKASQTQFHPATTENSSKYVKQANHDTFLSRFNSIEEIAYKEAYHAFQERRKKKAKHQIKTIAMEIKLTSTTVEAVSKGNVMEVDAKKKKRKELNVLDQLASHQLAPMPKECATTKDGQTAMSILKQFQDSGLIGEVEWTNTKPSKSMYASFNPQGHEHVSLTIKKGKDPHLNVLDDEMLTYEQDREVNHIPRQAIKQHLATFAICDIAGPKIRWSELTYNDLKEKIASEKNVSSKGRKD